MSRWVTTPAGYRRAQARLDAAVQEYERIVAGNADAADAGDNSVWHDNFAYEENQRQMHQWSRRVRDLRELMSMMEVIRPDPDPRRVQVGCVVVFADADSGAEERMAIAGWEDGDPRCGRIAYNAPLAQALLGAVEGDVRTLQLGARTRQVEVVEILPLIEGEISSDEEGHP